MGHHYYIGSERALIKCQSSAAISIWRDAANKVGRRLQEAGRGHDCDCWCGKDRFAIVVNQILIRRSITDKAGHSVHEGIDFLSSLQRRIALLAEIPVLLAQHRAVTNETYPTKADSFMMMWLTNAANNIEPVITLWIAIEFVGGGGWKNPVFDYLRVFRATILLSVMLQRLSSWWPSNEIICGISVMISASNDKATFSAWHNSQASAAVKSPDELREIFRLAVAILHVSCCLWFSLSEAG